jgi:hypothetical protein
MTDDEAARFNVNTNDRLQYLRFDDAKANFNAMSPSARWFVKRTETVPNEGDGQPGDEVGALLPWQPPNPFSDMDAITANKALDAIAAGRLDDQGKQTGEPFSPTRRGASNKRWAGHAVTRVVGCSDEDADTIISTWIKNGVLTVVEDMIGRKPAKCVKVMDARRPGATIDD